MKSPHDPTSRTTTLPETASFRFSIGSILLATTCFAILVTAVNRYGAAGVITSAYWFYLALPTLMATFVGVSLQKSERISSDGAFVFFAFAFAIGFFWFGAIWPRGTLAACAGPIFFWPPQVLAIVYYQSRTKSKVD